jgi:hypothetical protein
MLAGAVGGLFLTVQVARGADIDPMKPVLKAPPVLVQPAVDGFNAKWDALGGTINGRSLYGSRGSFSIPLATQWGLQIDAQAGSLERRAFGAIGGHLFWRDPMQGLIGIYANHVHWDQFGGVHATHVAGEGELYLGRFTIQAIVGVEFGNSVSTTQVINSVFVPGFPLPNVFGTQTFTEGFDVKTRFMDQINLKYYFTDNWSGYLGHRYLGGKNALAVGSEAAIGVGRGVMASAFIEGRIGERQFEGVWGGLRFYFGQKDKTLIRRHREDDPIIWDSLHTILNNYNSRGSSSTTVVCPNGSPPNSGGTCESFSGPP